MLLKRITLITIASVVGILAIAQTKKQAKDRSAKYDGMFTAAHLTPIDIGRKGLVVSKPFSKVKAMKLLLPGNYYHVETMFGDTGDLIAWDCRGCKGRNLGGWIDEEPINNFPRSIIVTEACDTLMYTDDNHVRHIIMSLAGHNKNNGDDLYVGRFFSVAMGLAWFTERSNGWVLDDCEMGLGAYGAFQRLPKIELIKLGKNNYGCYITNANGGPGQVYEGDLYVFARVNGKTKIVLTEKKVSRGNTPSSAWGFDLSPFTGNATRAFMPVTMELNGIYKKNTPDTVYDWTDHPEEMDKPMLEKDSILFNVSRVYEFDAPKYRKSKAILRELSPGDTTR